MHLRRKFVEAWEIAGKTGITAEAIDLIGKIYAVKSELRKLLTAKRMDEKQFHSMRAVEMLLLFAQLRDWLMAKFPAVTPHSKLGMAIEYAQIVFDRTIRFVDHSLMTPDTNPVENAIRPFVVGRKNWFLFGSPKDVHASAELYSLIEMVKVNGYESLAYLCHFFNILLLCTTDTEREALLP